MAFVRNMAILAVLTGAYLTNPEERSFQAFVEDELKKDARASWLERKVAAHLGARLWRRENYVFFSLVRVPEDRLAFVGVFGRWFRVPMLEPRPRA